MSIEKGKSTTGGLLALVTGTGAEQTARLRAGLLNSGLRMVKNNKRDIYLLDTPSLL